MNTSRNLRQLLYVSRARPGLTDHDVRQILGLLYNLDVADMLAAIVTGDDGPGEQDGLRLLDEMKLDTVMGSL